LCLMLKKVLKRFYQDKIPFKDISFRAYTGELEAWGQKPKR